MRGWIVQHLSVFSLSLLLSARLLPKQDVCIPVFRCVSDGASAAGSSFFALHALRPSVQSACPRLPQHPPLCPHAHTHTHSQHNTIDPPILSVSICLAASHPTPARLLAANPRAMQHTLVAASPGAGWTTTSPSVRHRLLSSSGLAFACMRQGATLPNAICLHWTAPRNSIHALV